MTKRFSADVESLSGGHHVVRAYQLEDRQREMFPVIYEAEIEFCDPNPKTADAWGDVIVSGDRFLVKTDKGGLLTRGSEWVVAQLIPEIGLSCPDVGIIRMRSTDEYFFGSKYTPVADKVKTRQILHSGESQKHIGLKAALSAAFAMDMFLNNEDRHDENFLLHYASSGRRILLLIDHARCLFSAWPIQQYLPESCNTRSTAKKSFLCHGFDLEAALYTLDQIAKVAPQKVIEILRQVPKGWVPEQVADEFSAWWGSPAFRERLAALRMGFEDGSLL